MSGATIPESEILDFLKGVEEGAILLQPEQEPQHVYAGNISYTASNGWRIVIFNDANEWDYIERIQLADGRVLDFDQMDTMDQLRNYEPTAEIAWSRYGIPGYMKYKCKTCGAVLAKRRQLGPPFLCDSCQTNP